MAPVTRDTHADAGKNNDTNTKNQLTNLTGRQPLPQKYRTDSEQATISDNYIESTVSRNSNQENATREARQLSTLPEPTGSLLGVISKITSDYVNILLTTPSGNEVEIQYPKDRLETELQNVGQTVKTSLGLINGVKSFIIEAYEPDNKESFLTKDEAAILASTKALIDQL